MLIGIQYEVFQFEYLCKQASRERNYGKIVGKEQLLGNQNMIGQ